MAIFGGLKISFIVALTIAGSLATPLKRSNGKKSARQIEFTTPSSVLESRTGYPEAGFRPKIPFDLPQPKAVTEAVTEVLETLATTTSSTSTLEDFDEVVPTTTTIITGGTEVVDYTPADTYGAPAPSAKNSGGEFNADVVPAPAEDFQPPSQEDSQDFSASFIVMDNVDSEFIADIPAAEQTSETKTEAEELEIPSDTYGAPESENKLKTDVETIEQQEEGEEEQVTVDTEIEEGSAESELAGENKRRVQEPSEIYGAPDSDIVNEIAAELAEVEKQIQILSRLTKLRSGRIAMLPSKNERLVSAKPPKKTQRLNGRLMKL
uniref:DUF4794 domain-containing protein n=1 Tax=Stomoxys calcitrans TaxID=35570 RepID=A0A1I8P223_STOCA